MTRALILAAGQGTRLRPITDTVPKCLVELQNKSLLERQTNTLQHSGIDKIHVATGFCAEQIESLGFDTSFNARFAESNMVVSLFCCLDFLRTKEDIIISYGDIIYQSENLQALLACNDEIALMIDASWKDLWSIRFNNPLDDAETLIVDKNGYIIELGNKTASYEKIQGQYTGLIKIRGDKLAEFIEFYEQLDRTATYLGRDFDNMYMTDFLQLLINDGWNTKAVWVKSGWLEVDSVEDLTLYESLENEGGLASLYRFEDE